MSNNNDITKILGDAKHLLGVSNNTEIPDKIKVDEPNVPIEKTDIESIFAPTAKEKIVNKGFTIREDQAKRIEKYSKRAKKKESEFMRDLLDYVFGIIENEE